LNNSIKFTKQGFVRLTAEPVIGTENVQITVKDSGIGMKDRDVKTLFQAFTHIDHEDMANINPSGVGLGLSIAYNLADLLGPTGNKSITVSSIPDQGSVFSFVVENKQLNFPQTVTEDEKPTNEEISLLKSEAGDIATEPVLDLKKFSYYSRKSFRTSSGIGLTLNRSISGCCQVLLVDDDTFNILAYKSILNAFGVRYECCFNGKSAIDKIAGEKCGEENCTCFSVVFMDQEMPEMSGIEAVQEIRKLEAQKKISKTVVIGCTAHDYQEKIDGFLKAGINECIKKPVSMEEIQRIIDNYLI
jgi:CheY-like chemotaxis protein